MSLILKKVEYKHTDNNILFFEKEKLLFKQSLLDFLFFLVKTIFYKNNIRSNIFDIKISQLTNNSFYTNNNTKSNNKMYFFYLGLQSVWKHMNVWVLPIIVALLFVYFSFFLKSLPFTKVLFAYLLLASLFYLFISGFVFFIKKYQYRLYTSAIQRFWRRSLIIFWAIEGFLFAIFFYLILNANQEPVYMYDNVQVFKTHFYSWRYFLVKIILSSLLIILTYMLMLSLRWNTFVKTNNIVLFITVIILYITWLEFYQLFHLVNCYGTTNWVYDFNDHLWNLEVEFKRTRIVNHYVTIGLIAKFWHVIFAVVFWIFFILRGLESSRFRYPLLAANLQNFLIIYVMSWLYMYPWFKYNVRRFLDMPFFWFFVNNRKLGIFLFINDFKLYMFGLFDYLSQFFGKWFFFQKATYFYWHGTTIMSGNTQFRKHNIRDVFIKSINV